MIKTFVVAVLFVITTFLQAQALERPDVEFKIFQFPADKIPCIDGNTEDWEIVSDDYIIGTDQLSDTVGGRGTNIDTKDIDIKVRVGWVKGLNRLYFLYEAYDDYWDFERDSLQNDIFELVVDGDLSGGPLIKQMNPNKDIVSEEELHFMFHGVHAQNYHIFTPPGNKDWNMVWGCPQWTKDLPYANHAYSYDFKHGESGNLVLEFWITPFDFAPYEGPENAVISQLRENTIIGVSWSILEYDNTERYEGFYNLSHKTTMYGDASDLCAFRLMPLEEHFLKPIDALWTFKVLAMDRRLVAFMDLSHGTITKWMWDFGDGATSTEQNPIHAFDSPGEKTIILIIEGPDGKSKFTRVWDVVLK